MSLKQIFGVVQRLGIQVIRSRWTIPYLILFPLFFIGIYWFGFSASEIGTNKTFKLGILNSDKGFSDKYKELFLNETLMGGWLPHTEEVIEEGLAIEVIDLLSQLKYSNETDTKHLFEVVMINSSLEANTSLEHRELDLLVVFPPNYTNVSLSAVNNFFYITYGYYLHEMIQSIDPTAPDLPTMNDSTTISILGDETYVNFVIAKSIITIFLEQYHDLSIIFDSPGGRISVIMNQDYLINLPKYSFFEMMVPGLIMFGIIIQPSFYSTLMCNEFSDKRKKTFDRILVSPLSAKDYIIATLIVQLPVLFFQTVILFLVCFLLGFNPQGDILLGFLIACSLFPFAASINYITAALFSDEDVSGTVTGFGAPILGFMSGAFVEIPRIVLIPHSFPTSGGMTRDFLLWDLLPLTHGVNAIRQVLLYNFSIEQVIPDIVTNLALSSLMLVLFMYIFKVMRFRRR
ncbi:MAG: ABC transporter permease [Candidatus Hodarchaeota archaeon]